MHLSDPADPSIETGEDLRQGFEQSLLYWDWSLCCQCCCFVNGTGHSGLDERFTNRLSMSQLSVRSISSCTHMRLMAMQWMSDVLRSKTSLHWTQVLYAYNQPPMLPIFPLAAYCGGHDMTGIRETVGGSLCFLQLTKLSFHLISL